MEQPVLDVILTKLSIAIAAFASVSTLPLFFIWYIKDAEKIKLLKYSFFPFLLWGLYFSVILFGYELGYKSSELSGSNKAYFSIGLLSPIFVQIFVHFSMKYYRKMKRDDVKRKVF